MPCINKKPVRRKRKIRRNTLDENGESSYGNINNIENILNLWCLVSTKRSQILKQTCSFQFLVCLSMWPFSGHQAIKGQRLIYVNATGTVVNCIIAKCHSHGTRSQKSLLTFHRRGNAPKMELQKYEVEVVPLKEILSLLIEEWWISP